MRGEAELFAHLSSKSRLPARSRGRSSRSTGPELAQFAPVMVGTSYFAGTSPAAVDVTMQDTLALVAKHAYVRELLQAFLDLMAADLNGPLAEDYRSYIRHEVKPVLDRIQDNVHAHFSTIESPSLEWLMDIPRPRQSRHPEHHPGQHNRVRTSVGSGVGRVGCGPAGHAAPAEPHDAVVGHVQVQRLVEVAG